MKKQFFLLAVSVLILAASAAWLRAGPLKKSGEWKQHEWKVPKPQYSMIGAVNVAAGTVSIKHVGGKMEQDRDLRTNAFTEIIVDGKRATLASLNKGMHVTYTLGGDGNTAARIESVVEPPPPPTPVPTATPSFPNNRKK